MGAVFRQMRPGSYTDSPFLQPINALFLRGVMVVVMMVMVVRGERGARERQQQ